MRRYLAALLKMVLVSTLAFAHGKEEHLLGTVKAISEKAITVEVAKANETKTVAISDKTKFLKSGEAATWKDLKVGDRVAIAVDAHGEHLEATVVKFGVPKARDHKPMEHAQH